MQIAITEKEDSMNIQIMETVLNGEKINSVNARELYNNLGLAKGQYSRWIQNNLIDQFLYNDDYIGVRQVVEGNKVVSHIVTLDTAKHLCMMAKTENAMKFRKYFIDFEKQHNKPLTISEQIALIAQGHQEVEQRLTQIEHKIENDITLTSMQKHHLKKAVNKKVYELIENHKLSEDFIKKGHMRVWKKIKDIFVVSSYMEIPKSNFDEAYGVVNLITIDDLM